ncbi:MAG: hypothetical protein AABO57_08000 [Acidobacteriota bacterium]
MEDSKATRERSRVVTGMFKDRESAERAYQSVTDRGYKTEDVNLLMSDDTRKKHFTTEDGPDTDLGNKALKGVGTGSAIGGTVGAILALIGAAVTLAIPGLNIIAAGPIVAALTGAGAGGIAGGLIGGLVGWGIPEERAKAYESGLKEGGIVMGVNPRNDADAEYFEQEWKKNRGEQIYR